MTMKSSTEAIISAHQGPVDVTPETTVGEVMRWAESADVLGRGDVVLTEQDHAA